MYLERPLAGESWLHRNIDWLGLAGTIFGLLAIVVAIAIYFKQKERRTLDWLTTGVFPIISMPSEYHGPEIQVTANGEPITNPIVTGFVVKNTGTVPLRESEFEKPVTFAFPKAKINTFALVDFPKDTAAYLDTSDDRTYAQVRLGSMNRGESFKVQFLVDGESADYEITSRIIGETRPMREMTEELFEVSFRFLPFIRVEVLVARTGTKTSVRYTRMRFIVPWRRGL